MGEKEGAEHLEEVEAQLRRLQESLDAYPDDAQLHFDLGLFLWEKGGQAKETKEKAAQHFVISAKLNPNSGKAFKFLGHYYGGVSIDTQRALKCYQRAVALNPDDYDSGEALCNLLDEGGKESLEVAVCREASEKSPRAFWAFRRLGYLQAHRKNWSEAVQSLQHAIQGYLTYADLWETLGLAYQRLGRFTAAIKSYGRAIELDNTLVFALVESGNIFLTLGSFKKGVELFRQALEISPQCVSAHYGLASGLLGLAKDCINLGAYKWAASLLEEAFEVARASTYLVRNVSCIWKLCGDIQLAYAKCYPWIAEVHELQHDEEAFKASILSWRRACSLAAGCARFSYERALHLAPWQANIYADIAVTSYLILSLNTNHKPDSNAWQLPEKMSVGALLLEGDNYEFWVALGCLSDHNALKQHALIRGLQLNVSLAIAWCYLGKLYRKKGQKQMARQAFDRARSIDPGLALPWASMSAESNVREPAAAEAYESCSRAVQIMPLPEFQVGLAWLALLSGHLSSSQVFGAIQQAVQRAPHYPESLNLYGLVCEARRDYQSAVTYYRLARYAINSSSSESVPNSQVRDVTINLVRSLSKAGNAEEALQECENLKEEGALDAEGLQAYAFSLWQLGENDLALSVAKTLAASLSSVEKISVATSMCFICRILYHICGVDSAINKIVKMPKELFQNSDVIFIISAIHALDEHNRLSFIVSSGRSFLKSHEEITEMHFLIALGKLVKNGSEGRLGVQSGVAHLRKALHMYPNSNLMRNMLGYLLLLCKELNSCHAVTRCCKLESLDLSNEDGLKSPTDIHGAAAVACHAIGNDSLMFTFPTCTKHSSSHPATIRCLQKYFHQKPWNYNARYLLVLNILQRARELRFPHHLCIVLNRLIFVALSNELYDQTELLYEYRHFQLLLCASEVSLQCGNQNSCIIHAERALEIVVPDGYLFFAHLLLCRVYAMKGDLLNLQKEYRMCLELKTDCHIGWICLKLMESRFQMKIDSDDTDLNFKECVKKGLNLQNMWMAVYNLVRGLISLENGDLLSAEEFMRQACLLAGSESCHYLCYGALCMELGRQLRGTQFLSQAVKSLTKVHEHSVIPFPLASLLLAQAEGSLGSKDKWSRNLCLEWHAWPPEMRPAELLFQMHLVARQLEAGSNIPCGSPQRWVIQAIHMNPSCMRYWTVLQKYFEMRDHTA